MAYEFKKLADVEAAETASEAVNILVEDEGVIKRVPKEAVAPEVEISEGFSGSWNDLTDKPFGETDQTTVYVEKQTVTLTANEYGASGLATTKIARITSPDVVGVKNFAITINGLTEYYSNEYGYIDFYDYRTDKFYSLAGAGESDYAISISTGTSVDEDVEIEIVTTETAVTTLDPKFLPDSVKAQADWSVNDPESAAYVANRTHYEETTRTIEWDSNTSSSTDSLTLYGKMRKKTPLTFVVDGEEYVLTPKDAPYTENSYPGKWGYYVGKISMLEDYASSGLEEDDVQFYLCVRDFDQSSGTWYEVDYGGVTESIQLVSDTSTVRTLDPKFMPKSEAMLAYASGDTVSASQYNELLDVLVELNLIYPPDSLDE